MLTKVCLVKAMVFPVVMYGCESWTIKKAEWRRKWQPTPVLLPGESHGQRSLVGYSPWGYKGLDTTELSEHTHKLSYKGESNKNIHLNWIT